MTEITLEDRNEIVCGDGFTFCDCSSTGSTCPELRERIAFLNGQVHGLKEELKTHENLISLRTEQEPLKEELDVASKQSRSFFSWLSSPPSTNGFALLPKKNKGRIWCTILGVLLLSFAILLGHPPKAADLMSGDVRYNDPIWTRTASRLLESRPNRFNFNPSIDKVEGVVLSSGVHTWKIRVHKVDGILLGVSRPNSPKKANKNIFFSTIEREPAIRSTVDALWVYDSNGEYWSEDHEGKIHNTGETVTLNDGDTVTFTIDLTGQGTLHAAVNKLPSIELFRNLKAHSSEFVPAAFLYGVSLVGFVGFV